MHRIVSLFFPVCLFIFQCISAQQPVELGDVHWFRSLEAAQEQAKQENKPILILFQEVPGCTTCKNYGKKVLTHPLIVEAIEDMFVPLAIYNNKGGADKEVLDLFHEPSWNNPVVRIVDQSLSPLAFRVNMDYTEKGLLSAMHTALIRSGQQIPAYLTLLEQEFLWNAGSKETAVYAMHCFWTGEAHFGGLEGVISTEPGFLDGREVVRVTYHPAFIQRVELDRVAARGTCRSVAVQEGFRPDDAPLYYLLHSKYRGLDMTRLQAMRVNRALCMKGDPERWLSPRQLAALDRS